ncbi:MAG: hypothetical protein A2Z64_11165 [Betaproteobacteria bacterium RIFCSPLOWO2_02_67_12]|nr:MAG: hypothetical protein A2Z64_11165 [Betaproteobacteria bacterium RIFCSPLOWO2_02_67_12]
MPSSPSNGVEVGNASVFAVPNTHDAEVPESFGPAIPGWFVYPHELTEMMLPSVPPVHVFVPFCTQGPPEDPPESPQFASHQLSAPVVVTSSAQYMNFGSWLYE